MKFRSLFTAVPMFLLCVFTLGAQDFQTSFAKGKWNRKDFLMVKSPRLDYMGIMLQGEDHIYNKTPDLPDDVIFRKHCSEVYAALVLNRKYSGNAVISSKMSFDHRMAPLIVIAPELGLSKKRQPEFREHFEIVLYDEGINVWHHTYKDGTPQWHLAASLYAKFQPKQVYDLRVELRYSKDGGGRMTVTCNGQRLRYEEHHLPRDWYAGIIACEGRNRFYDFNVFQKNRKKTPGK